MPPTPGLFRDGRPMTEPGSWRLCQRYAHRELRLEVNHKAPLLGADRSVSRGNHQGNLKCSATPAI